MKHFLSFQKRKAIYLPKGSEANYVLAMQLNEELMLYGFEFDSTTYEAMAQQSVNDLDIIYHDLLEGIRRVAPNGGYKHIYPGFPNTVSDTGVSVPRQEIDEYISKPLSTRLSLITKREYDNIFYNMIYSNNSINKFDKEIIEYFLFNDYAVDFKQVVFKEIFAYIGTSLSKQELISYPLKMLPMYYVFGVPTVEEMKVSRRTLSLRTLQVSKELCY